MNASAQDDSALMYPFRITPFLRITRPFTLLPPFLGIVSGSFAALGSLAATGQMALAEGLRLYWHHILLGGAMAALLNAASNVLNQVTEVEVDRKNKPDRVLPRREMSVRAATAYAVLLYVIAMVLAWMIQPEPGVQAAFWCALAAAVATVLYSVKPVYAKSRGWWANITIAVPRGCLLKVAGWGCVASVWDAEPWFIGAVFMLFLLGAASSKDFSDMKGDGEAGIRTLPVIHGPEKTASLIAPFFVLPWLLLIPGVLLAGPAGGPILHASSTAIVVFGIGLATYGAHVARLMRNASATSVEGNHPAWKHMYLLMMTAQIGLVVCYFI